VSSCVHRNWKVESIGTEMVGCTLTSP
jgi:hypothetical protein